jgi:hypothetical protein
MHWGLTSLEDNRDMENDEEVGYCEELGIDADLVPYLAKEGISLLVLKCVQYWRRGYGGADIGRFLEISTEEAEASISYVQQVMPGEMLDKDTDLRNEIIESGSRFEKTRQKLHESLTRSVDEYLAAGEDPIKALQAYREFVYSEPSDEIPNLREQNGNICRDGKGGEITEDPSQIKELRKRDANQGFDAKAKDRSEEEEQQLIKALRQEANPRTQTANMENPASYCPTGKVATNIDKQSIPCNRPEKGQSPSNPIPTDYESKGSRRITIRVSDTLHNKIQGTAQSLNVDLSSLIRELLEKGLECADANTTAVSFAVPQEAFEFSPPFRAWCGDLRLEFKKRFLILLALGHESAQRWPKTEWLRRLYLGLLPLQSYLEKENVRHD